MLKITTPRLELQVATPSLLDAALESHETLSLALEAQITQAWPPQFFEPETLHFVREKLRESPESGRWWTWFFLLRETESSPRTVIGFGGFKGVPDANRHVEIGYSVASDFQNQGLASEAIAGLCKWAFAQGVQIVTAQTLLDLGASIRVLEKNGFELAGQGDEEGVLLFRKTRDTAST